jgi:O-antigen/teichoic acid export membrane protein
MRASMPEASVPPARPRGLRFALLAHPSVQGVRFLTKLALPWFFTTTEYGEAVLPSLIVFGLQHVAVFGLDEALVSVRKVDAGLWRAMRGFQNRVGLLLAAVLVLVGLALQAVPAQALLGRMLIGLAPMLVISNRATLPTWLLVRERRFRDLFVVDLGAIVSFAVVTLLAASLGLGSWSLVAGWTANGVAACLLSTWRSRDLVPPGADGGAEWPNVRRNGRNFSVAAVLGYVGERIDGLAVGFVLGRSALGLFDSAHNMSSVLLGWGQSVADRFLFPTLAAHDRAEGLGRGYLRALRTTILFLVPPHVVLALASDPLIRAIFPEPWHATAPLVRFLALAAAARCIDLLAVTALKAAGDGAAIVRLGTTRLALLAMALVIALPFGLEAVAMAVLASRVLSAANSIVVSARRLHVPDGRAELRRACTVLLAWAATTVAAGVWILRTCDGLHPAVLASAVGSVALCAWIAVRLVLDRDHALAELSAVRARIQRGRTG